MDTILCKQHGYKYLHLVKDEQNYYLCRLCLFDNKDHLNFYFENFENFKVYSRLDNSEYLSKLNNEDYFHNLNKVLKETLESIAIGENIYPNVHVNKERFRTQLLEALYSTYKANCDKFEKTVDELTVKTDKLDLTLKSAKDELQEIQKSLEEQITVLESETELKKVFDKVMLKFSTKLKYLAMEKFIDPELKIDFSRGSGNINFKTGNSPIVIATNRGGSYWADFSEEEFEGPFFARLRVNNITRKSDWSLNIGIVRANSTNTGSYYQEGVFFMCSGKITVAFQGNQGRNFQRQWNNGDEVLIRRDETNQVFFGLNDESTFELAYPSVPGRFKLCVGFSSSMVGDNIEIIEIDN